MASAVTFLRAYVAQRGFFARVDKQLKLDPSCVWPDQRFFADAEGLV